MSDKQKWISLGFEERKELLKQIWTSSKLADMEAAYKWDKLLPSTQQKLSAIWNQGPADSASAHSNGMRDFAGLPEGLDSARYRALGNAVTVQVAYWIARRMLRLR